MDRGEDFFDQNVVGRAILVLRFLRHIHPRTLPVEATRFRYTWCMGGIAAALFGVEVLTGIALMFYYRPTPESAYFDLVTIREVVPMGWGLHRLHRFASHGLLFTVFLHMLRVLLTGSYKPPRQMNWLVGVTLLLLTQLIAFTGYLLPWDQNAYWTTVVGTNLWRGNAVHSEDTAYSKEFSSSDATDETLQASNEQPSDEASQNVSGVTRNDSVTRRVTVEAIPSNGRSSGHWFDLRRMLLGGETVDGTSLLRFYLLHCVVLPLLMTILIGWHFWKIRKDGGISQPL